MGKKCSITGITFRILDNTVVYLLKKTDDFYLKRLTFNKESMRLLHYKAYVWFLKCCREKYKLLGFLL